MVLDMGELVWQNGCMGAHNNHEMAAASRAKGSVVTGGRWSLFGAGYDAPRNPADCLHCKGTMRAPGDGKTACGFCDTRVPKR